MDLSRREPHAFTPPPPGLSAHDIAERTLTLMQQQRVQREQWEAYVIRLYKATRAELPSLPQMGEVDMIYDSKLRLENVKDGSFGSYHCEEQPLVPFKPRAPHSPLVAWFLKPAPFAAIPSNTWTEVTHCGGSTYEAKAAWFYIARGSGIYVNTGKTITFDCHQDAVKHFLGTPCGCKRRGTEEPVCEDSGNATQCDKEMPQLLPDAAEAAGYDSIQFVRHCDICALPTLQCGHELMMVKATDGGDACPKNVDLRSGLGARGRCHCVTSKLIRSFRGGCAVCADGPPRETLPHPSPDRPAPTCSNPPGGHLHAIRAIELPNLFCSERYGDLVECGGKQLLFTRNSLHLQSFETLVRARSSADANFSAPSVALSSELGMSHNAAFLCLPDGVTVAAYGGLGSDLERGIRMATAYTSDAPRRPLLWSAPVVVLSGKKKETGCLEEKEANGVFLDMCEFDGKLSVVAFAGRVFLYSRFNLARKGGAGHVVVTSSVDGRQRWDRFQSIRIQGYDDGPAASNIYYFAVQHAKEASLLVAFYPAAIEGRGCVYRSTSSNGVDFTAPECLMPSTIQADFRTGVHPLDALLLPGTHVGFGAGSVASSAYRVLIEHDVWSPLRPGESTCEPAPYICEYAMRRWPPRNSTQLGNTPRDARTKVRL